MNDTQLPLILPHRPALERGDFFVAQPNALAVAQLDDWHNWPQRKMILVGPMGAGKTHLARVWAASSNAHCIDAGQLLSDEIPTLASQAALVVEDVDQSVGDRGFDEALFHLHNLILAEGGALLLTARSAPQHWPMSLPDLASRMMATPTATIGAPDDALLSAVLVKLFADRQLAVPPALIPYLVDRMERCLGTAQTLVDALDRAALAQKRKISVRLAGEVLDNPDRFG